MVGLFMNHNSDFFIGFHHLSGENLSKECNRLLIFGFFYELHRL